jgi:hypothetical protein
MYNAILLTKEVQLCNNMVPLCKNCVHYVHKHVILPDFCNKFKTSALFARLFESKCGYSAREFKEKVGSKPF